MYRPWELDKITMRELILAIEGLRERDKFYHDLLRRATYIIGISGFAGKWVQQKFDNNLWPVAGNRSVKSLREKAFAHLRKLREVEDQKIVKAQLDGGGT